MKKYQDIYINGVTLENGKRECYQRYDIIKNYLISENVKNPKVIDIGANMAYFGIRLIEDFNAEVIAFEYHQFKDRWEIIKKNKCANKLMYINRKVNLNDMILLQNFIKADIVLCLSVLHHVSEPMNQWINAINKMSKYLFVEVAGEDSQRTKDRNGYYLPENYLEIGESNSHLAEYKRKIVVYKNI